MLRHSSKHLKHLPEFPNVLYCHELRKCNMNVTARILINSLFHKICIIFHYRSSLIYNIILVLFMKQVHYLSIYLSIYLPTQLLTYLPTYPPTYIPTCCSHLEHRASVKRFVSLQFLNLIDSR
jgi:hypothetical protein